jgi:sRNA-binding protein
MMPYKYSVEEKNDVIRKLAEQYPKTFFDNPKLRVPVMKNVVTALLRDGFPMANELISESVDWYMSHLSYQYNLEAGKKRINLHGTEEGTVTEQEERIAKRKIADINEKKLAERHIYDPIRTAVRLREQLSDKKIDAPQPKIEPTAMAKPKPSPVCPELEPVYQALLTASAALPALASNVDMQIALLRVISKELDFIITNISGETSQTIRES